LKSSTITRAVRLSVRYLTGDLIVRVLFKKILGTMCESSKFDLVKGRYSDGKKIVEKIIGKFGN